MQACEGPDEGLWVQTSHWVPCCFLKSLSLNGRCFRVLSTVGFAPGWANCWTGPFLKAPRVELPEGAENQPHDPFHYPVHGRGWHPGWWVLVSLCWLGIKGLIWERFSLTSVGKKRVSFAMGLREGLRKWHLASRCSGPREFSDSHFMYLPVCNFLFIFITSAYF